MARVVVGTDPEPFIYPDWPAPDTVRAAATTRYGGYSAGAYAGRNLGDHVGDDPQRVRRNRNQLVDALSLPAEPGWLEQVHGADLVQADHLTAPVAADAAWTDTPGVVCAVLTADCLPVLFCNRAGTRVAAAHAGWRGLCKGVLQQVAENFRRADISPAETLVWLGPAIGPQAYEVDAVVRDALLRSEPGCADSFTVTRPGHWNLNLYAAARAILAGRGISGVSGGDQCTYTDPRFYSHRREPGCGRQATLIWLTGARDNGRNT